MVTVFRFIFQVSMISMIEGKMDVQSMTEGGMGDRRQDEKQGPFNTEIDEA